MSRASIFGDYGRGRSSTGGEVFDQPYFTEPRPGKSGKCRVRAFHYPGHEELCDKLCQMSFLGNCFETQCGFSLMAPSSSSTHTFRSSEAAYQALQFWDDATVFESLTGVEACRLKMSRIPDNTFSGFGSNWSAMKAVLRAKFSRGSDMATRLMLTGDDFLLEHHAETDLDSIWSDNADGTGQNWLGLQLMIVRDELAGLSDVPESWTCNFIDKQTGKPSPRSETAWQATVQRANEALRKLLYTPICNFPGCSKRALESQQGYCCKAHKASHQHMQLQSPPHIKSTPDNSSCDLPECSEPSSPDIQHHTDTCLYPGCKKLVHKAHPGYCGKLHKDRHLRDISNNGRPLEPNQGNPPKAPAVASRACENFNLNMAATQFGMCHCGFDRKAHEERDRVDEEQQQSAVAQTPPKCESPPPAQTPEPPGQSSTLFSAKCNSLRNKSSVVQAKDNQTVQFPVASLPSVGRDSVGSKSALSLGRGASLQHSVELESGEPEEILSKSEVLAELQHIIRAAGFLPPATHARMADAVKFNSLPRAVRDAISTIMSCSLDEAEQEICKDAHELRGTCEPEPLPLEDEDVQETNNDLKPKSLDRVFVEQCNSPQCGPEESPSSHPHPTNIIPLDCVTSSSSESRCAPVAEDLVGQLSCIVEPSVSAAVNMLPVPAQSLATVRAVDEMETIHTRHFSFSSAPEPQGECKPTTSNESVDADDMSPGEVRSGDSFSEPQVEQFPPPKVSPNLTVIADPPPVVAAMTCESDSKQDGPSDPEHAETSCENGADKSSSLFMPSAPTSDQVVSAPCDNFSVDLSSAQFGMCLCGFPKASHAKVVTPSKGTLQRSNSGGSNRGSTLPVVESSPPPASGNVCSKFQLDTTAAQFGICRCGFAKQSHSNTPNTPSKIAEHPPSRDNVPSPSTSPRSPRFPQACDSEQRNFTLEQLKEFKRSGDYQGLDASRLEIYLDEAEFVNTFGVSSAEFMTKLPPWKREQAKKKAGIF